MLDRQERTTARSSGAARGGACGAAPRGPRHLNKEELMELLDHVQEQRQLQDLRLDCRYKAFGF